MSKTLSAALAATLLSTAFPPPLAAEPLEYPSETDRRYYEAWGVSPDDAEAYTRYAKEVLKAGKLADALAYSERALELDPNSVPAHHGYALALARAEHPEEALEHFARVVGTGSHLEASAHSKMGRLLGGLGRQDEAFEHFEKAVELNPDRPEAHYNVGIAYYRKQRLDEAAVQLERAVELDPNLSRAHRGLAQVYVELGRHKDAITRYEALLRINKHDAFTLYAMGVAYDELGESEHAQSIYERALVKARKSYAYRTLKKQLEERLAIPSAE